MNPHKPYIYKQEFGAFKVGMFRRDVINKIGATITVKLKFIYDQDGEVFAMWHKIDRKTRVCVGAPYFEKLNPKQ